jgi:ribosomal protein S27E
MKVIKEGIWNAVWQLEVSCETCAAVLLAEEADLKSHWEPVARTTEHYVNCPSCKREILISAKMLTPRLVEKLEKREPPEDFYWSDWH